MLLFHINDSFTVKELRPSTNHSNAITAIVHNMKMFASGDVEGCICVFRNNKELTVEHEIQGDGYPITDLALNGTYFIASYSTGHVRLYRMSTGKLAVQVAAHGRSIYAMSLHNSYLATVGEDTYLNVWSIPGGEGEMEITLMHNESVEDRMLTGVEFNQQGDLLVTAYDTCEVFTSMKN